MSFLIPALIGLAGSGISAGLGAYGASQNASAMQKAANTQASAMSEAAKLQLAYQMMQQLGLYQETDPIMRMWASTLGLEPDKMGKGFVKTWKDTGKPGKLWPDWITGELSPYMNEAFAKQRQTAWEEPIHELGKLNEATLQGLAGRGIGGQSPLAQSLGQQARLAQFEAGRQGQQGIDLAKLQAQENQQNQGRQQWYQNLWNLPQLMIQKRGFGQGQMAQGFNNLFQAASVPRYGGSSSPWPAMGNYLGGLLSNTGNNLGWQQGWNFLNPQVVETPQRPWYQNPPNWLMEET